MNDIDQQRAPGQMSEDSAAPSAALFKRFRHRKIGLVAGASAPSALPPPPASLQDLDIGLELIVKLILKHLHVSGALRIDELAQQLGIPVSLIEEPIQFLRKQSLIEARSSGVGGAMSFALVGKGRERALASLEENAYCGPLPVSLEEYRRQVDAQSISQQVVTRERVQDAFQGVVVQEATLTKIGAAFNSGNKSVATS